MYAIIKTGGKQYRVTEKDVIEVDKLDITQGDEVVLDQVLLISDGDKGVSIGAPYVSGAKVVGKIVRHYKGRKINGFTYKKRKDCHRRYGHRQQLTSVMIETINLS